MLFHGATPDKEELKQYLLAYCQAVGTDEIALPEDAEATQVPPPESYQKHRDLIAAHLIQELGREGGTEIGDDGELDTLPEEVELIPLD